MPVENEPKAEPPKITTRVLRWSREPLTRLQVIAIWAFVAVVFAATKSPAAWQALEIASVCCVAFFVWPFIQGPFLLYARHKVPLRLDWRTVPEQSEALSAQYRVKDLLGLGFTFAGGLAQFGRINVGVRLEMFLHKESRDSAQLARIKTSLKEIDLLVFKCRFVDGFAFETSNGHTAPLFEPDPNYRVFRFPDVRSTPDLYRLHCKLKEQFISANRPTLADEAGELAEFTSRAEISHQRHAQSGVYKLAPVGDCYLYTWKGAIRHACLMAWPIKQFRRMAVHRLGMRTAERIGLPINPKLGRLLESLG